MTTFNDEVEAAARKELFDEALAKRKAELRVQLGLNPDEAPAAKLPPAHRITRGRIWSGEKGQGDGHRLTSPNRTFIIRRDTNMPSRKDTQLYTSILAVRKAAVNKVTLPQLLALLESVKGDTAHEAMIANLYRLQYVEALPLDGF